MARISLLTLLVKLSASVFVFLITTYAVLLRSTTDFDFRSSGGTSSSKNDSGPGADDHSYMTGDGDFCVLPDAIVGENRASYSTDDDVTLVTQSSINYLDHALEQSRLWDGPVSFALYLPSWTWLETVRVSLVALGRCDSDFRRKVSMHFFYPSSSSNDSESPTCPVRTFISQPPSRLLNVSSDCRRHLLSIDKLSSSPKERNRNSKSSYPVNTGRNIARRAATTRMTLVADVELLPSPGFATMFKEFYRSRHAAKSRQAFVAPVFELDIARQPVLPRSKDQLHEEARGETALPFHSRRIAYECHRIPSLGKWWQSGAANRSRLGVFAITPWIRPCWEPVFLSLSSETPSYDERFRGYGKNKIQQVYEMCRANFTFYILDNAYFVHKNISILSESEWNEISYTVTRNNALYEKFRRELDTVYTSRFEKEYCDTYVGLGTPFVRRL